LYSVGPERAVYERTIEAFHCVVAEDAEEILRRGAAASVFRNIP